MSDGIEPACRLHKISVSDRTLNVLRRLAIETDPGHPLRDELRLLEGRWDAVERRKLEFERSRREQSFGGAA